MYLRCSAGTVEWMYPTGALIVNLRPNTFAPSRHLTLCIKPLPDSSGANIYLEKTGELQLLVRDGDPVPGRARCFGLERGGLFVEATPQQDIGRRSAGFQYELSGRRAGRDLHAPAGEWAPGASVLFCQTELPSPSTASADAPPVRASDPAGLAEPGPWCRGRALLGAAVRCGRVTRMASPPFCAHSGLCHACSSPGSVLQRVTTILGVAAGQGRARHIVVLAPMGPSPVVVSVTWSGYCYGSERPSLSSATPLAEVILAPAAPLDVRFRGDRG